MAFPSKMVLSGWSDAIDVGPSVNIEGNAWSLFCARANRVSKQTQTIYEKACRCILKLTCGNCDPHRGCGKSCAMESGVVVDHDGDRLLPHEMHRRGALVACAGASTGGWVNRILNLTKLA